MLRRKLQAAMHDSDRRIECLELCKIIKKKVGKDNNRTKKRRQSIQQKNLNSNSSDI